MTKWETIGILIGEMQWTKKPSRERSDNDRIHKERYDSSLDRFHLNDRISDHCPIRGSRVETCLKERMLVSENASSLTCLCLQVDNEKLSHALLCLFTSVCLGFSKAFLIICYWHSCGTIFDLSENDIIIVGVKRPRLHFPLRQMKRQMGKIKNSIWRAKHTFRHTHKHALIVNLIPRVLDQVWSLGAVLMINERSITTVSADVLLPVTQTRAFAHWLTQMNFLELFYSNHGCDLTSAQPVFHQWSEIWFSSSSTPMWHTCIGSKEARKVLGADFIKVALRNFLQVS